MVRARHRMSLDKEEAFSIIKPVSEGLMSRPTLESLSAYSARIAELKKEVVQELQQYILFPLITRLTCNDMRHKIEMHLKVLDSIRIVLEKITVNNFKMYMKLELGLLNIISDDNRPGMVSDASEEVKYSTVRCLTVLMLSIPHEYKMKVLEDHSPMLAQTVFVCVHIAKIERLRVLRLAAIQCITAQTLTHPQLTVDYHMPDPKLEILAVDKLLCQILPGVLAALQDVCNCTDNPTHTVIVAALDAIHRILCIPMNDKYFPKKPITTEDFVNMLKDKKAKCDTEVSNRAEKDPKEIPKRSEEWFTMAGEKLTLVTKGLVNLRVHDHFKVRKELAIFCYRTIAECSTTMPYSVPLCLDVLISFTKDEYPEVSKYCSTAVSSYLTNAPDHIKLKTLDSLCENFISLCTSLPRIMNNIDESRKLSALNLLYGYIEVLCAGQPQRLTAALSAAAHMQQFADALCIAAEHDTSLVTHTRRVHTPPGTYIFPSSTAPWSILRHISTASEARLQLVCMTIGASHCAELLLDVLLDAFRRKRTPELVYILNWMIASVQSTPSMARRLILAYIDYEVWYLPLEVGSGEVPITADETVDVTVYNPRAWNRDSVPGLYEGTVESRYTDISYLSERAAPSRDGRYCATLAEAQRNLTLCCLLTEGIGNVARRLRGDYENFLLKTLCPILERVGSEYELLHLAGLKAMNYIAHACGHMYLSELINCNADYFTNQVSVRLRKRWTCQSALQILSVVMEFSDPSISDCLYGIVEDVLVQSCDKYYEKDLHAYLQAFLSFVECIRKWYPVEILSSESKIQENIDLLTEVREYVRDTQEAERLLSDSDFEKSSGKSVEEMYREDLKRQEEEIDYDEGVTNEKKPLPQHVTATTLILKRCLNFITSPQRDDAILALQILNQGLPILAKYEDELLPLVHQTWAPLVARFQSKEPVVLRRAFDLLVTLAALSKDFILNRTVKEVLPEIYKYLHKSSKDSYLKDKGSAYRNSQAYLLQVAALDALPSLAVDLGLEDERLTEAMTCVQVYLSNKQPKPLQASAVKFFKTIIDYEYAAAWYHLRKFCNNDTVLQPPKLKYMTLEPIVGTPFQPKEKEYEGNIKLIFDFMVS